MLRLPVLVKECVKGTLLVLWVQGSLEGCEFSISPEVGTDICTWLVSQRRGPHPLTRIAVVCGGSHSFPCSHRLPPQPVLGRSFMPVTPITAVPRAPSSSPVRFKGGGRHRPSVRCWVVAIVVLVQSQSALRPQRFALFARWKWSSWVLWKTA